MTTSNSNTRGAAFNLGPTFALIATLFYALSVMITRKLSAKDIVSERGKEAVEQVRELTNGLPSTLFSNVWA